MAINTDQPQRTNILYALFLQDGNQTQLCLVNYHQMRIWVETSIDCSVQLSAPLMKQFRSPLKVRLFLLFLAPKSKSCCVCVTVVIA